MSEREKIRIPLKLRCYYSVNGAFTETQETTTELVLDHLGDGPLRWQMTFPAGKALERQGGVTVRWSGEPYCAGFKASPEVLRTALTEQRALVADVELPLMVETRQGKEIVRDGDGRVEGAIETTFVELRWGLPDAA
jgi:hypothetical protein